MIQSSSEPLYYGGFPLFMRFFRHCRAWPTASAV